MACFDSFVISTCIRFRHFFGGCHLPLTRTSFRCDVAAARETRPVRDLVVRCSGRPVAGAPHVSRINPPSSMFIRRDVSVFCRHSPCAKLDSYSARCHPSAQEVRGSYQSHCTMPAFSTTSSAPNFEAIFHATSIDLLIPSWSGIPSSGDAAKWWEGVQAAPLRQLSFLGECQTCWQSYRRSSVQRFDPICSRTDAQTRSSSTPRRYISRTTSSRRPPRAHRPRNRHRSSCDSSHGSKCVDSSCRG